MMTENDYGERIARIEGAQDFMVEELRRARISAGIAWGLLVAFLVVAAAVGVTFGESLLRNCGWG